MPFLWYSSHDILETFLFLRKCPRGFRTLGGCIQKSSVLEYIGINYRHRRGVLDPGGEGKFVQCRSRNIYNGGNIIFFFFWGGGRSLAGGSAIGQMSQLFDIKFHAYYQAMATATYCGKYNEHGQLKIKASTSHGCNGASHFPLAGCNMAIAS